MTAKLNFTSAFVFIGSSVLSAQTSVALHPEPMGAQGVFNTIHLLEQNALWVLIGAVVLMGVGWICSVLKACTQLNKSPKNSGRPSVILLFLITGLSVFCGSCSTAQRAMAARYRAASTAENRNCPYPHHCINYVNTPFNNRYPSNSYSNLQGPSFCKYCGQRILDNRN